MIDQILAEREKTHGDFKEVVFVAQGIKRVMRLHECDHLSALQKESLDMIASKIGRILAGDPDHIDHWLDIAGYATLVAKELESHGKKDPA